MHTVQAAKKRLRSNPPNGGDNYFGIPERLDGGTRSPDTLSVPSKPVTRQITPQNSRNHLLTPSSSPDLELQPLPKQARRGSRKQKFGKAVRDALRNLTNSSQSSTNGSTTPVAHPSSPVPPERNPEIPRKIHNVGRSIRPNLSIPSLNFKLRAPHYISPLSPPISPDVDNLTTSDAVTTQYFTPPLLTDEPTRLAPNVPGLDGNILAPFSHFALTCPTSLFPLNQPHPSPIEISGTSTPISSGKFSPVKKPDKELRQELMSIAKPCDNPIAHTVFTAERATATKIFFETYYNGVFSEKISPRSLRRRAVEAFLSEDRKATATEKEAERRSWEKMESEHLRRERVMKGRGLQSRHRDPMVNSYEVVKVLGKGSFGVVRLVRERNTYGGNSEKRGEVFAMKAIHKTDMLRNSQEGHLKAERDFLVNAEGSRWIVPLVAAFQDTSNLYLIMQYQPGGDFLGLLIRENVLNEFSTKFYVAEMILCIEESHRLGWIHRDVKPDNFLIATNGHLLISDFGLAFDGHWSHDQAYFNNTRYSLLQKLGIQIEGDDMDKKEAGKSETGTKISEVMARGRSRHEMKADNCGHCEPILNWRNRAGNRALAKSVVGTSQYMAPEVVKGEAYDARCDWWSLAVILYECLYGHTPFLAEEGGRQQTKANILEHETTFVIPSRPNVSQNCRDLLRSLITERTSRLSCRRYRRADLMASTKTGPYHNTSSNRNGLSQRTTRDSNQFVFSNDGEDIKSHPWFRSIAWDKIHLQAPPLVPCIRATDDTHYFDEEEPISDFSTSNDDDDEYQTSPATDAELNTALAGFNREIQVIMKEFVQKPYDTKRLKGIEGNIVAWKSVGDEGKQALKGFVRAFGHKERKRPRDLLLRDPKCRREVLRVRKELAFKGYSYRRMTGWDSDMRAVMLQLKQEFGEGNGAEAASRHNVPAKRKTVWQRMSVN